MYESYSKSKATTEVDDKLESDSVSESTETKILLVPRELSFIRCRRSDGQPFVRSQFCHPDSLARTVKRKLPFKHFDVVVSDNDVEWSFLCSVEDEANLPNDLFNFSSFTVKFEISAALIQYLGIIRKGSELVPSHINVDPYLLEELVCTECGCELIRVGELKLEQALWSFSCSLDDVEKLPKSISFDNDQLIPENLSIDPSVILKMKNGLKTPTSAPPPPPPQSASLPPVAPQTAQVNPPPVSPSLNSKVNEGTSNEVDLIQSLEQNDVKDKFIIYESLTLKLTNLAVQFKESLKPSFPDSIAVVEFAENLLVRLLCYFEYETKKYSDAKEEYQRSFDKEEGKDSAEEGNNLLLQYFEASEDNSLETHLTNDLVDIEIIRIQFSKLISAINEEGLVQISTEVSKVFRNWEESLKEFEEKKADLLDSISAFQSKHEKLPSFAPVVRKFAELNGFPWVVVLKAKRECSEIGELDNAVKKQKFLAEDKLEDLESSCLDIRKFWAEKNAAFVKVLSQCLQRVCSVHLPDIIRLIKDQLNDNSHTAPTTAPTLYLLGSTGGGKTTTVHFLHGSTFTKISIGMKPHYEPTPLPKNTEQLRWTKTSRFQVSETSKIHVTTETINGMTLNIGDTPGSGDTKGYVVDIVNAHFIAKAFHSCDNPKVAVVISGLSLNNRLNEEPTRELFKTFASILNDLKDLEYFNYIFTRTDTDEKGIIEDFSQALRELPGTEKEVKAIWEDILRKIRVSDIGKGSRVFILREEQLTNPNSHVEFFQHFALTPSIRNPKGVISDCLPKRCRTALEFEFQLLRNQLVFALETYNERKVKYILTLANELADVLPLKECSSFLHIIRTEIVNKCELAFKTVKDGDENLLLGGKVTSGNLLKDLTCVFSFDEFRMKVLQFVTSSSSSEPLAPRSLHFLDCAIEALRKRVEDRTLAPGYSVTNVRDIQLVLCSLVELSNEMKISPKPSLWENQITNISDFVTNTANKLISNFFQHHAIDMYNAAIETLDIGNTLRSLDRMSECAFCLDDCFGGKLQLKLQYKTYCGKFESFIISLVERCLKLRIKNSSSEEIKSVISICNGFQSNSKNEALARHAESLQWSQLMEKIDSCFFAQFHEISLEIASMKNETTPESIEEISVYAEIIKNARLSENTPSLSKLTTKDKINSICMRKLINLQDDEEEKELSLFKCMLETSLNKTVLRFADNMFQSVLSEVELLVRECFSKSVKLEGATDPYASPHLFNPYCDELARMNCPLVQKVKWLKAASYFHSNLDRNLLKSTNKNKKFILDRVKERKEDITFLGKSSVVMKVLQLLIDCLDHETSVKRQPSIDSLNVVVLDQVEAEFQNLLTKTHQEIFHFYSTLPATISDLAKALVPFITDASNRKLSYFESHSMNLKTVEECLCVKWCVPNRPKQDIFINKQFIYREQIISLHETIVDLLQKNITHLKTLPPFKTKVGSLINSEKSFDTIFTLSPHQISEFDRLKDDFGSVLCYFYKMQSPDFEFFKNRLILLAECFRSTIEMNDPKSLDIEIIEILSGSFSKIDDFMPEETKFKALQERSRALAANLSKGRDKYLKIYDIESVVRILQKPSEENSDLVFQKLDQLIPDSGRLNDDHFEVNAFWFYFWKNAILLNSGCYYGQHLVPKDEDECVTRLMEKFTFYVYGRTDLVPLLLTTESPKQYNSPCVSRHLDLTKDLIDNCIEQGKFKDAMEYLENLHHAIHWFDPNLHLLKVKPKTFLCPFCLNSSDYTGANPGNICKCANPKCGRSHAVQTSSGIEKLLENIHRKIHEVFLSGYETLTKKLSSIANILISLLEEKYSLEIEREVGFLPNQDESDKMSERSERAFFTRYAWIEQALNDFNLISPTSKLWGELQKVYQATKDGFKLRIENTLKSIKSISTVYDAGKRKLHQSAENVEELFNNTKKQFSCFLRVLTILPDSFLDPPTCLAIDEINKLLKDLEAVLKRRNTKVLQSKSPKLLFEAFKKDQKNLQFKQELESYFETFIQKLQATDSLNESLETFSEYYLHWRSYAEVVDEDALEQLNEAVVLLFQHVENEFSTLRTPANALNSAVSLQFMKSRTGFIIKLSRCQLLVDHIAQSFANDNKTLTSITENIKKALLILRTSINFFSGICKEFDRSLTSIETSLPSISEDVHRISLVLKPVDFSALSKLEKTSTDYSPHEDLAKVFIEMKSSWFDDETKQLLDSVEWNHLENKAERVTTLESSCLRILEEMTKNYEKSTNTPNRVDRNLFYGSLYFTYSVVKLFSPPQPRLEQVITKKLPEEIQDMVNKFVSQSKKMIAMIEINVFSGKVKSVCESLNKLIDNLDSIKENCRDFQSIATKGLSELKTCAWDRWEAMFDLAWLKDEDWGCWPTKYMIVVNQLVILMNIVISIPFFAEKIRSRISQLMSEYVLRDKTKQFLSRVGDALSVSDTDGLGQKILTEIPLFNGYKSQLANREFLQIGYESIINDMRTLTNDERYTNPLTPKETEKLVSLYESYHELYVGTVNTYLLPTKRNDTVSEISKEVFKLSKKAKKSESASDTCKYIVRMISYSFALWTLHDLSGYDAVGSNSFEFLTQPHPGQVLVLFRILGLDSAVFEKPQSTILKDIYNWFAGTTTHETPFSFVNRLAEIKTGQGKSVVLAVLATVLALLGYRVDIACYSGYLTNRDKDAFAFMFKAFGVDSKIHYDTFKTLCERLLHGEQIRSKFAQAIAAGTTSDLPPETTRLQITTEPTILLIDEVDVLLSSNFYGKKYVLLASLLSSDFRLPLGMPVNPVERIAEFLALEPPKSTDFPIQDLIRLVWDQRDNPNIWGRVAESDPLKRCFELFPNWKDLIESAARQMCGEVKEFRDHKYDKVDPEKGIGYVDDDQLITYRKRFGYLTMFAYLKENEKDSTVITDAMVEKEMRILIKSGTLSYAKITSNYSYTFGVTGTLRTLTKGELDLLETGFKIEPENCVVLPSAYPVYSSHGPDVIVPREFTGTFMEDILFGADPLTYYQEIVKEIIKHKSRGRPVLVFFQKDDFLNDFAQSAAFASLNEHALKLVSLTDEKSRDSAIEKAIETGRVTLLIASYGRGTDFNYHNKELDKRGGIHVIQTFFSLDTSEETQIMGRTNRQGHPGSYSMVLQQSDFQLVPFDPIPGVRIYDALKKAREVNTELRFKERLALAKSVEAEHDESEKMIRFLLEGKVGKIKDYLEICNRVNLFRVVSRTIILIDATGSMQPLLGQCKTTVKTALTRANQILYHMEKIPFAYEIQFVAYRNYSSKREILQPSPFHKDPESLSQFIETVECSGGQGNEAVEIGLLHVNRTLSKPHPDKPTYQVILIGDAPPNTDLEVINKRSKVSCEGLEGEKYWKEKTEFKEPTHYLEQINEASEILKQKVNIFTFYLKLLKNDGTPFYPARKAFAEIATRTGVEAGSELLKIDSKEGEEQLTNLIAERVLGNIQRHLGGGTDLVQLYKTTFRVGGDGFV